MLPLLQRWADPIRNPLPGLGEEVEEVGEVCLASRGADDGLDGNTEKRQCEEEDEHPENEMQHGRHIIQHRWIGASISA